MFRGLFIYFLKWIMLTTVQPRSGFRRRMIDNNDMTSPSSEALSWVV